MICRNCQAKIADKAIVCYRCGTPTAMPVPTAAPGRQAGGSRWVLSLLVAVLAVVVWWQLPGPPTDAKHLAAAAVAVLALIVAVIRRLRSRR
jgi:hypothetical protein